MSTEAIPALNHPDRASYERAYREGNAVLRTSFSLDAGVRRLRTYAKRQTSLADLDLTEAIHSMEQQAHHTLHQDRENKESSWNELYRLVSKAAFLEQTILAPFLFEDPMDFNTIGRVVDGLYGINGAIIDQQLSELSAQQGYRQRTEITGAIHEQTVSALLHRAKSKRLLALPPETSDDLHRRVDLNLWRRRDHSKIIESIPVQIKASIHKSQSRRKLTPVGGITITAADFDNTDLAISRLIVKELAFHEADGLTDNELITLDCAQTQLYTAINSQLI